MLKQKVTDLSSVPMLSYLRALIVRHMGSLPERLEVFRLTPSSDFPGIAALSPRYTLETPNHMTPTFSFTRMEAKDAMLCGLPVPMGMDVVDIVEVEGLHEPISVALLGIDEAAESLARELVEVS
jgi:hypothetical protein